ncbi:MAG: hypothetical protein J7L07_05105 [Candidatus Odinarchaeota archaeon]|nr:hypothetical protein [Candidatus Odinarchaeota archaeon]
MKNVSPKGWLLIFLLIMLLGNLTFIYWFYSSFLAGPPVHIGTLTFIAGGTRDNVTAPTNEWWIMLCDETDSYQVYMDIFHEGIFIRPYKWSIVKRGTPINDESDLDRYLYKDFPYLNMTYINFKLWVFDGRNETLVINYTAPIWKFNENNTEFPYYYSKKLDYQVWHIEVYSAFLSNSVSEISYEKGVKFYVLFRIYVNRSMDMANRVFFNVIFRNYALTNLYIFTIVIFTYILKVYREPRAVVRKNKHGE